MTNAEMLAKVRMFLDESAEDFYFDDEEIYPALTEAQREIAKTVADAWFYQLRPTLAPIPKAIQTLITTDSGAIGIGAYTITPTKNILVPASLRWSPSGIATWKPAVFVTEGEIYQLISNKELVDGTYAWWIATKAYVNPISTSNTSLYEFKYITEPTVISASVSPILDPVAHDATVERALWILMKDRETQQAQLHLQLFGQLLQGLIK